MFLLAVAAGVLAVGVVLTLAAKDNEQRAKIAILSQAIASVLTLVAVLPRLFGGNEWRGSLAWSYPTEAIAVHVDALSAFFLSWSLPMTLVGTIYASGYLRSSYQTRNAGVQFALLNVTSLSFLMIYTLETASVFLLGWEIAAVAAWLLVIWEYRNQKIRFAGFNYLVSTHIGFFFLVAAFMVMYSQTGSLDFASFEGFLRRPSGLRSVTFFLLLVSFGLKSAFFPFHTWLPRAHSAAPAHVSALMSGVIHKAGLFGLLRFLLLIGEPEPWMGWTVLIFSAVSAFFGVLYTTSQRDLKRLLGYSSTENVGIVGIGIGVGCLGLAWHQPILVAVGFTGGILHIVNHAFFKCLLFYSAGAVYRSTHSVDLERLGGLAKTMPRTAGFYLLGGLAISALPPFNGFISEFLIYSGLLGGSAPAGVPRAVFVLVAALLAFLGGISALAMTRSFGVTFLGSPRDATVHHGEEAPRSMQLSMALHAAGVLLLGLFPALGLALVEQPVRQFLRLTTSDDAMAALLPLDLLVPIARVGAGLVALMGVLWLVRAWLDRRAPPQVHVTWACGYPGTSPRMQYTGTSFAQQFASLFHGVLPQLRREKLPTGLFPKPGSHLNTHTVDAVEQRVFEVLGQAEQTLRRVAGAWTAEPRFSFAAGLVMVILVFALILAGTGAKP